MLNPYNYQTYRGGFRFVTVQGDIYYAYFTPFTLMLSADESLEINSFGFECERKATSGRYQFDARTKLTIAQIIVDYFSQKTNKALLYICQNNDERARHRNITFNQWFSELGRDFELCRSNVATDGVDFYSALIVKRTNPQKDVFVQAFNFTIDYWFPPA